MKIQIVVLLGVVSLASGCGPVYAPSTSYIEPESVQGVACTMQCENVRLQCQKNTRIQEERCRNIEEIESLDTAGCIAKFGKEQCLQPSGMLSSQFNCKEEFVAMGCKESYNICYQACGGQVISKEMCVKNCR